jgi:ABC-type phosphate transport system substrate-binding protein
VGAGGAAAANLYNSYGVYYGYYKDNVALAYLAAPISQALTQYNQTLVDFVGVDTALDPDQLEGVSGLVQLPTAGLPLVLGYNLSSSLLANDSLVRTTHQTTATFFPVTQRNGPQPPHRPRGWKQLRLELKSAHWRLGISPNASWLIKCRSCFRTLNKWQLADPPH